MSVFTPESCFRFVADQISLLRNIYYRPEGLAESELRQLISRLRKPENPSSSYIFRQLRETDIVEEMPGQTAFFELTAPWKEILGYLFREQRLTNVAVIQTYLNELQRLDVDLSVSVNENEGSQCVILLQEIHSLVERLRRDSRDNRLGIISEALKFKSGGGDIAAIERYDRIIHLWEKYVEPLRDIIDSRKEMDDRLRSLETLMKDGADQFRVDGIMEREFLSMHSRLIRLLRDAMEDYRESVRELEPLYNEALSNSRYLRGATLALNRMSKTGRRSLNLKERMSLPSVRTSGAIHLLSDEHVEAYLCQLSDYHPIEPQPVGQSAIEKLPTVVPYLAVRDCLAQELPVDDALEWLCATYPELSLHQTLGLYGRVFGDSFFGHISGEAKEYRFDSVTACTHTLKLEVASE
jgi:hypothetical protein